MTEKEKPEVVNAPLYTIKISRGEDSVFELHRPLTEKELTEAMYQITYALRR